MKSLNIALLSLGLVAAGVSSCDDRLDVINPNQQTTENFGKDASTLKEAVIACYNHIRMEGTFARVGYNINVCRGDEAWNAGQVWYLPFDNLNIPVTEEIASWSWRDWYYTINVCNYVLQQVEVATLSEDEYNEIKGQALFIRGMAYYELSIMYKNPPVITDYSQYSSFDGLYLSNADATQDKAFDQVEADLKLALDLLPSKDKGGEWAKGRANKGAAAGYLSRALMFRHKFADAKTVLLDIINGKYGKYDLTADFGDNFKETNAYENNIESLFEIQYLDYGSQGTDDEWTPVNTSANATQGHAIESNFGSYIVGGWADISASTWLYNLYKKERTASGALDPRLYYTCGTYEADYPAQGLDNMFYGQDMQERIDAYNALQKKEADKIKAITTNANNGGIPIVKHTSARQGIVSTVVTGLHCGVNLRIIRFSEILLLAAEAINEVDGPAAAIPYINRVRQRAGLKDLDASKFGTADKLFEQIANVERPKELGCENIRIADLLRWGFFYDSERLAQMKLHTAYIKTKDLYLDEIKSLDDLPETGDYSLSHYQPGHEYLPIWQGNLDANPNLVGNCANNSTDNAPEFFEHGYKVHPVTSLD